MKVTGIITGLALLLAATAASAQSTAAPVVTGYLTTSGCPYGQTTCFVQYGATPPAPGSTTIIGTDAASTNGSSTVATGNAFQIALAASATRKGCLLYNPSTATEPLYVSFAASPSTTTNSIILGPGDSLSCAAGTVIIDDAVKVTAATTSHVYILYSQ